MLNKKSWATKPSFSKICLTFKIITEKAVEKLEENKYNTFLSDFFMITNISVVYNDLETP